ncbi:hypothetical protein BD779DRAFT_1530925 [Infundibulicybe gibba]|nr:hypothetical protein BD779DRAFT_1530925 [Infundibulicybe gibba]
MRKIVLTKVKNDVLAHQFFTRVLPRHYNTLASLSILVPSGGLWCFGPHNLDALLGCTQLTQLSISVCSTTSNGEGLTTFDDVLVCV